MCAKVPAETLIAVQISYFNVFIVTFCDARTMSGRPAKGSDIKNTSQEMTS